MELSDHPVPRASLEMLPVELIAAIFSQLDIPSLKNVCSVSSRLRTILSDPLLNPWRPPILRSLFSEEQPHDLGTLSVLSCVPRQNWLEILCYAPPDFLLFQATLPNLKEAHYEEAFKRRFLPSWAKIRKDGRWKEAYTKMLFTVHHRLSTNCTTTEAWTNYIILNRNGSANCCFSFSRTFDPAAIFRDLKTNANLDHLETSVRLVIRLADVRIIVFGVLHRPTSLFVNPNARFLLNPPDVMGPQDYIDFATDSGSEISVAEDGSDEEEESEDEVNIPASHTYDSTQEAGPDAHASTSLGGGASRLVRARSSSLASAPASTPNSSFWRTRSRESSRSVPADDRAQSSAYRSPWQTFVRFLPGVGDYGATSSTIPSTVDGAGPSNAGTSQRNGNEVTDESAASPQTTSRPNKRHRTSFRNQQLPSLGHATLRHPTPHPTHINYPNFTPDAMNGQDWRWFRGQSEDQANGLVIEDDKVWVGPMLITAHLSPTHDPMSEDLDPATFQNEILLGHSHGKWASVVWADLFAIAPWLHERITKRIDGEGLGIE